MVSFLCFEAKRPSQQFFSHVRTEPPLPVYYQYFRRVKCLAQGHTTGEVAFELINGVQLNVSTVDMTIETFSCTPLISVLSRLDNIRI